MGPVRRRDILRAQGPVRRKSVLMLLTLDFETFAIQNRPDYPPEPVGVSLKRGDAPSHYLSWGHPDGNNCTREEAVAEMQALWADESIEVLCHHAKFDMAVAYEKLGLPVLPWNRVHDTMLLLFLADPHSKSLALKDAAARYLDMPPDEQEALHGRL